MGLHKLSKSEKRALKNVSKIDVEANSTKMKETGVFDDELLLIKNLTGTTIPQYGVVFCTGMEDATGADGAKFYEVKSYSQIVGTDEEDAKNFPVFCHTNPIEDGATGEALPRGGIHISKFYGDLPNVGEEVGPIDSTDPEQQFSLKKDSDEPMFFFLGSPPSNGWTEGEYATVTKIASGGEQDKIRFINKSTQAIQPHGVAFATKIVPNEDDTSWYCEVKAWNEIKDDSTDKRALAFPIINGASEVLPDETGSTSNRDGYWIAEVESKTVTLGGLLGPYDGPTASKKFMLSRDSDEKIFESVDSIDAELFGGDTSKYYALVRNRVESEEADPLGFFVGTITELGDFPEGRNGTGGSPNFFNTRPGRITAIGTYISGSGNSGNFTVNAYYYGPFPLAVGAYVACLKWSTYGNGTGPEWWVVDASRYELPTRGPGGGVGGVG